MLFLNIIYRYFFYWHFYLTPAPQARIQHHIRQHRIFFPHRVCLFRFHWNRTILVTENQGQNMIACKDTCNLMMKSLYERIKERGKTFITWNTSQNVKSNRNESEDIKENLRDHLLTYSSKWIQSFQTDTAFADQRFQHVWFS